jgi:E3 ubiquitin-protein ligase TRIP12
MSVGPTEREAEPVSAPSPSSAIPSESPTNKILRLLKVVHELTVEARGVSSRSDQMDETLFVNNKLTAKLTRQLEEVMILARYVPDIV